MAGGKPWTGPEEALIIELASAGKTNAEIYDEFQRRWPGRRGKAAVKKRRADLSSKITDEHTTSPQAPDETISVSEDGDIGEVVVMASESIKTPEALFEKSGLDPDVWEIVGDSQVRKWDVPMKVGEQPVVIPCFYVSIKVRKKWEHSRLPMPVVLKITRPRTSKPTGGAFTSVHFSDIHFPFHDPRVVNILYQILDYTRPGFVADHGDTIDCTEISKYPKDPFHRVDLKDEIRMGAEHFGTVHALTPDADHVWLEGNHEQRLQRLVWSLAENRAAGEILTLPAVKEALSWPSLLGIGELGWETVPYPGHKLLFNKLILCHGEKVRGGSGSSEKAEYQHYGKGGISGHTHRIGYFGKRDYDGEQGWWGLGCCCLIRADYTSFPNWQQGFAVVTWSKDRSHFAVERVRIFDGVAHFRGKRFVGDSKAFGDLAAA